MAPDQFAERADTDFTSDVISALDWSVGEVMRALADNGLDGNTLVVFTSDNGPWYQGSPGELQGRKGSTYEGGIREPMIARMPGQIPPGTECSGLASQMDLLPTFSTLANTGTPAGIDGVDIWPMLSGQQLNIQRDALLIFDSWNVQCIRSGPWNPRAGTTAIRGPTIPPVDGRISR